MANIRIRMSASQVNGLGDQMLPFLRVRGWRKRKQGDNRSSHIEVLALHKRLQQENMRPPGQLGEFLIDPLKVLAPRLSIIKDIEPPCPIEGSGGPSLFTGRSLLQILQDCFPYPPIVSRPM
jgi:hypothetical protein